jgi:hypothetical protein
LTTTARARRRDDRRRRAAFAFSNSRGRGWQPTPTNISTNSDAETLKKAPPLAGDGARRQRFAGARRSDQEHARGNRAPSEWYLPDCAGSRRPRSARLCFIFAATSAKSPASLRRDPPSSDQSRRRFADRASFAAMKRSTEEEQKRDCAKEQIGQQRTAALLALDLDPLGLEQRKQGWVLERRQRRPQAVTVDDLIRNFSTGDGSTICSVSLLKRRCR